MAKYDPKYDPMTPEEVEAYKALNEWIETQKAKGPVFLDAHESLIQRGSIVDAQALYLEVEEISGTPSDVQEAGEYLELFSRTNAVPDLSLIHI